MTYTTAGEIIRLDYDKVVDIERISFHDEKLKTENYLELPRSIVTFEEGKAIKVELLDEGKKLDMKKKPRIVMSTTLFLTRQSTANEDDHIFQFSAGGLIFRITSKNNQLFRLRGQRKYKLAIY
jgi:hypothetical protein